MDKKHPNDIQIGGGHYKDFAIQPAEFIERNKLSFLEGCVIKRICRWRAKDGLQDLEKAKHEIDLLIAYDDDGPRAEMRQRLEADEKPAVDNRHPVKGHEPAPRTVSPFKFGACEFCGTAAGLSHLPHCPTLSAHDFPVSEPDDSA